MKKRRTLVLAALVLSLVNFSAISEAKSVSNEKLCSEYGQGAKENFNMNLEELMKNSVFPVGGENVNYAKYFDGMSYLNMLSLDQVIVGNVTFEPGCRNHWHIHHAAKGGGQMLLVTAGRGYYQEWGKAPQELKPGDIVHIPAEVKHWHGAAPDSAFQHLAIEVPGEKTSNEWCEPVNEDEYKKLK